MDELQQDVEIAMCAVIESAEREASGLESATSGSSVPMLTLADLQRAMDATHLVLYYQTSEHLNRLDSEGKPVAYHLKRENCWIFHPDHLDDFIAMCEAAGYRAEQFDWTAFHLRRMD